MNTTQKSYSSKSNAKKALSRIFKNAGIFHQNGISADGRFCHGNINENNILTLSSNYWSESSLEKFLSGKEKL